MNNIEDIYPVSQLQANIFRNGNQPQSSRWCEQLSFCINGQIDVAGFAEAWKTVGRRQPLLRTSFLWKRVEQPVQVVHKDCTIELQQHDWRGAAKSGELESLLRHEREQGFDPAHAPLISPVLCREDEDVYRFIVTYHQSILDESSVIRVIGEVFAEYSRQQTKGAVSPSENSLYWQYLTWLNQEDTAAAQQFWTNALKNFTPVASDHIDQRPVSATQLANVSPEITATLETVAQRHNVSFDVLVAAAWALLQNRYSSSNDVCFGVNVSTRPATLENSDSIIGPLTNTLPLRVSIQPNDSIATLLDSIQARYAELTAFAHNSISQIREWNGLPEHTDLFDSILISNDSTFDALQSKANKLQLSDLQIHDDTNAPLIVRTTRDHQLRFQVTYDPGRFDDETIARMLKHFENLLEAIATQPEQRLREVSLFSDAELERILVSWNDSATDYPRDATIHQLFEQQVTRTPDAIAAEFQDNTISYSELNERANQLAHYLISLGLPPESPVAFCLEPSIEMVVAAVATLKAGACYLPLDPSHPMERIAFMIEDARSAVLLTQTSLLDNLPADCGQVICMDADVELFATQSKENPTNVSTADSLAYLIYTSGSTGTPKGISIPHRGVVRLVCQTNYIDFKPGLRFAQVSNPAFDAATFEFWGSLLHGGSLIGLTKDVMLQPTAFGEELRRKQIDLMFLTVAVFNQVARHAPQAFATMREVLFGGDAADVKCVRRVLESGGAPQRLINGYGPTETTTFATWHEVKDISESARTIPIGRTLANSETYVLDHEMRPVPIGVPGELYLGGDGLARGYMGQPAMTGERFVPDCFSGRNGARLYRTGDTCRYDVEGQIEFIGRVDNQVKIRGNRIELGEIEAHLSRHPGVAEVVVIVRQDDGSEKRLAAYVVAGSQWTNMPAGEFVSELRRHMRERVPEYMIPSAIVVMDEMPLTPNGKADRRAVPAPE